MRALSGYQKIYAAWYKRDCPVKFRSDSDESRIIVLDGTLLSPAEHASHELPCVLIRTPYRRENALNLGWVYAERGYHVLVQDTRGRFGSTGEFFPVANEIEDGRATVSVAKDAAVLQRRTRWMHRNILFGLNVLGSLKCAERRG